ncbi:phosphonate ABC transporter ATP-binding protein [Desulfogranum marinum]|jgi:phosphonate transport system ATP-binding protein|uniref:phosphonate ABC transporter ATP-binding protein n=1 Tax=Desulfogranum marinum TaxID=453220 RepID=UPI001963A0D1|nr:phosphonate ABC transporter ATP-binding protein [Desulfogranum marinum]MBM9511107.1 phosphonate ABC transporter ATP-binding protein [Desulfogranum marinum]
MASTRSIRVENLVKEYTAGKPVLNDISFTVSGKASVAIIGPSGTGKSTLIRCVNKLIPPTAGNVYVSDENITELSGKALRQARRKIGMVFQEFNLVERLSVMENVLSGRLGYVSPWRAWLRKYPQQDIDRAFELLESIGLIDFFRQRADSLSGGQRQRVGIARAIMQEPHVLLADEPTSSLDPKTSVEIMELLVALSEERGIPLIINIHDVELAKRFTSRVIGLSKGGIVYDGSPSALTNEHLKEIYGGEDWLQ